MRKKINFLNNYFKSYFLRQKEFKLLTENNSNTLKYFAVKFLTLTLFLSRGKIKKTV